MLKILFSLIAKLPNRWAQHLGGAIGILLFAFDNRERRVSTINIRLCLPELSDSEQQALIKKTLTENVKTMLELPRVFIKGGQYALNLVTEVNGLEHYEKALEHNKGVMLIAPHLGNWEVAQHYMNNFANITALFAPPKQAFLNDIMRRGRESIGATLVPADSTGVRAQLKKLKQGGVIGILPDQVPTHKNAGVFAPFMGHLAFTMTLINNFAKRSDASVLMVFAERLEKGQGYRMHILPAPIGIDDTDPVISATALNNGIEQCVRIAPAQYQWTYKRFKVPTEGLTNIYDK